MLWVSMSTSNTGASAPLFFLVKQLYTKLKLFYLFT